MRESPQLQGMLLHLRLQESPSSVAPNTSISEPAMGSSGVISPARADQPPNNVLSTPQSTEASFYIIFDQQLWDPLLKALDKGVPPQGTFRRMKKSRPSLSRGAAYLARKTLAITHDFSEERLSQQQKKTHGCYSLSFRA